MIKYSSVKKGGTLVQMQPKAFLDLILHQPLDHSPEKPTFAKLVPPPTLRSFFAVPTTTVEVDPFDGAKPSFSGHERVLGAFNNPGSQGCEEAKSFNSECSVLSIQKGVKRNRLTPLF